jgi:hypothetical protein
MRKGVSLDAMRELVGRALYGGDLIEKLSKEEWAILRNHGPMPSDHRRADGTIINHIAKCPRELRSELDRVLGRLARWDTQNTTIDSWILEHGLPVDPVSLADPASLDAALHSIDSSEPKRQGRKPTIIDRVIAEMKTAIETGRIDKAGLRNATNKTLPAMFGASWGTVRKARQEVLSPVRQD